MAKLNKTDYILLKKLPEEQLTAEERSDINEYERAAANAPSSEDVEWAREINEIASKNPSTLGADLKKTGDLDRALKILADENAYKNATLKKGEAPYVKPVKRIPDDLNSQFKFNWKSAYENTHPEENKLRDTEADYDKLKKFIGENMYEEGDPVELQNIAYKLHMYNPNTMKWTDFINSEQGKEFRNYIKDVEKYQQDKRIADIFDNESNFAVDFMLPVSKEYARNNYENIKADRDMVGPLATDILTNAAMTFQPGGKSTVPLINKASNFLAPALQNLGHYLYNDTDPAAAALQTVMGGAVNIGTPYALNRFNKYTRTPGQQYSQRVAVGERVDQIADKVGKIEQRMENGALIRSTKELASTSGKSVKAPVYYSNAKKKAFTDNPTAKEMLKEEGFDVSPISEMRKWKAGILSDADHNYYEMNSGILHRPFNRNNKKFENAGYGKEWQKTSDKDYKKVAASMAEGKDISQMNKPELEAILRGPAHETYMNWLSRNMPETMKNYMTNAMGRSQMGTGVLSLPQMIFQTNIGKAVEERKKKKPVISEIFGE